MLAAVPVQEGEILTASGVARTRSVIATSLADERTAGLHRDDLPELHGVPCTFLPERFHVVVLEDRLQLVGHLRGECPFGRFTWSPWPVSADWFAIGACAYSVR